MLHYCSMCPWKPNKMFPHHFRLSSLNFPHYFPRLLRISFRVSKRRLLLRFWCVFPFVTCLDFCVSRKAAFTGVSVRIAIYFLFLVEFAAPFLPAVLGKGRTSSGVKDVLEEGFVLACVLLEGPGLVEWILEGSGPADSSCSVFPLLQFDAALSVAGAGLSYIWGQKLLINKDISVLGKNSSGQESGLDICRSSCKVERHIDNSRSIVNRHRFSCVVCDPCFTCMIDIGSVAHKHCYQGAAACD
jgi:hypothetical protein